MDVLKAGGNAFDAGVAAAMALKVAKMGYAGWTGVAPWRQSLPLSSGFLTPSSPREQMRTPIEPYLSTGR
jgi:hypothetical protein